MAVLAQCEHNRNGVHNVAFPHSVDVSVILDHLVSLLVTTGACVRVDQVATVRLPSRVVKCEELPSACDSQIRCVSSPNDVITGRRLRFRVALVSFLS